MASSLEQQIRDRIVAQVEHDWRRAWPADIAVVLLPQPLVARLEEGETDHGWEDRFHCPSLVESILRVRLIPETWLRQQFVRPS